MKKSYQKIVITGSLTYDRIMDFPGKFKEHILPDKIHILNVSFCINGLKESFGGTAGNIAYNLCLLGEKPIILGPVGDDFGKYRKWLKQHNIDISYLKTVKGGITSSAYMTTDRDDNQISAFYPGPLDTRSCDEIAKIKNISLAIVSPELKARMMKYVRFYKKNKVPYIFDPGQQITSFTDQELKYALTGSDVLIGNDYEIQSISNRLQYSLKSLTGLTRIMIITKGHKGSEIRTCSKKIIIPPAKPKSVCDPTGAGDAYRAGLIKGLLEGWPLEKTGRFAGLISVHTVEQYGTQTHSFTWTGLKRRYNQNYKPLTL